MALRVGDILIHRKKSRNMTKKEAEQAVMGAVGFTLYSIMAVSTAETLPPSNRHPSVQGLLQVTALFSVLGGLALSVEVLDHVRQGTYKKR